MYLIDTDILIYSLKGHPQVVEKIRTDVRVVNLSLLNTDSSLLTSATAWALI